jgi:hypothetical protein
MNDGDRDGHEWRRLRVAVGNERDAKELDRLLDELIQTLDDGKRTPSFPDSAWKRERVQ